MAFYRESYFWPNTSSVTGGVAVYEVIQKFISMLNKAGITAITAFGESPNYNNVAGIAVASTTNNPIPSFIKDAFKYSRFICQADGWGSQDSNWYSTGTSSITVKYGYYWTVNEIDYFIIHAYNNTGSSIGDSYYTKSSIVMGNSVTRKYGMDVPEITTVKRSYGSCVHVPFFDNVDSYTAYRHPLQKGYTSHIVLKYDEDDFMFNFVPKATNAGSTTNVSLAVGHARVIPVFSTDKNIFMLLPSKMISERSSQAVPTTAEYYITCETNLFGIYTAGTGIDTLNGSKLAMFKYWVGAYQFGIVGMIKNIYTVQSYLDGDEYNIGGLMYQSRFIRPKATSSGSPGYFFDENTLIKE